MACSIGLYPAIGEWCMREKKDRKERGFLGRLLRDRRGNTLAMMAALLIPLIGMVGSGVDMARAYMAKAKLQTACDSAATAARRVMGASAFTTAAHDEGVKFFTFNFPNGTMKTAPVTLSVATASGDASVVQVDASTTVPTEIMGIFGATSIPISVTCSADKDYVNNDIMLVLDVTGSMNCTAPTGTSCAYQTTEQSNSRISKLRAAAVELYRTLAGATGVRTRYGFMPYSMTVNVGRNMQAAWLAGTSVYHKKVSGVWSTQSVTRTTAQLNTMISNSAGFCVEERSSAGQTGTGINTTVSGTVTQADIDTMGGASQWLFQPYDTTNTTGYTGAYANLAAFCPKPAIPLATYATEAAFQTALTSAVGTNGQAGVVGGYTNHDLGMVWGLRFLSGDGMFAASNPDTYDATADGVTNPVRVQRHIIFLTDGDMTADDNTYSAMGIPAARRRLVGGTDEEAKHKTRFQSACNLARTMDVTVWIIVLDNAGSSEVQPCATDSSHFFISDGSDLDDIFQLIGKGIGKLRLTS
jgi:Flp pilus assembly protein TadG